MSSKILYEVHDIHVGIDIYSFFFTENNFLGLCVSRASRAIGVASEVGWALFPVGGAIGGAIKGAVEGVTGKIGEDKREKKQHAIIDEFRERIKNEDPARVISEHNYKGSFVYDYKEIQLATNPLEPRKRKPPKLVMQCKKLLIRSLNWDESIVISIASILKDRHVKTVPMLRAGIFQKRLDVRRG